MLKIFRGLFCIMLIICFISGCGSDSTDTASSNFQVIAFSDVHFDPFYDPSLFQKLVAADASEWSGIFKTSSITTSSTWGSGTNYPLLVRTLSSIQQNAGGSPFVIFTGDILVHKFSKTFYSLDGSQDITAMEAFANKTVAFFTEQVRSSIGSIPVFFAIGNNDSYNDLGPDNAFLVNTVDFFYKNFLNGTVDKQVFLTTFKSGGYYSAEPPGTNLLVIGINTILFSPIIPENNDSAVNAELAWLDSKLAVAKDAGKKVWLLMHAPPGADIYQTATLADGNGHINTTSTTMMWKPEYQRLFLQIISKYQGIIVMTIAGHTHMDEYRIFLSSEVLEITPSIGMRSGNNPGYKNFTISNNSLKPIDYTSLNYDPTAAREHFSSYYLFSVAYSVQGFLSNSLTELFPALVTNTTKQVLYRGHYYSGNNSLNPISDKNWPIYWCGIGKMEQQEFINCVNSY